MSVFDLFESRPYKFLELEESANGYKVTDVHEAQGIWKLRSGKTDRDNMEMATSDAVLKVRPSESFASAPPGMVGQGIEIDGQTYRIEGQTEGVEHDTNTIDFYNLSLMKEDLVWPEQELPSILE